MGFYHDVVRNLQQFEFLSSKTGTQGNTYTLHKLNHNFDDNPEILYIGSTLPGFANVQGDYLHMYSVTLSVHGGDEPLPPKLLE